MAHAKQWSWYCDVAAEPRWPLVGQDRESAWHSAPWMIRRGRKMPWDLTVTVKRSFVFRTIENIWELTEVLVVLFTQKHIDTETKMLVKQEYYLENEIWPQRLCWGQWWPKMSIELWCAPCILGCFMHADYFLSYQTFWDINCLKVSGQIGLGARIQDAWLEFWKIITILPTFHAIWGIISYCSRIFSLPAYDCMHLKHIRITPGFVAWHVFARGFCFIGCAGRFCSFEDKLRNFDSQPVCIV